MKLRRAWRDWRSKREQERSNAWAQALWAGLSEEGRERLSKGTHSYNYQMGEWKPMSSREEER
jgi:hypothetical protein